VTNVITPHTLFFPICLQSSSLFHESGLDNPIEGYIHSYFPRWPPAAILDLIKPEIATFDPPVLKTSPRTKHEVDRMTRCENIGI